MQLIARLLPDVYLADDRNRAQGAQQGPPPGGDASEELLAAADAQVTLEFDPPASDKRVVELVNKTNQFNLNGVRFTDGEWHEKADDPDTFTVAISYQRSE